MAEGDENGYITHLMMETVLKALEKSCEDSVFLAEFRCKLRERTRFLDETSHKDRFIEDGESGYYGAFVLFDTKEDVDPAQWARIDKPVLFIAYMASLIHSCNLLPSIKETLIRSILAPSFLKNLMNIFREKSSENGLSTPWMYFGGNDPLVVYRNYCELNEAPNKLVVDPTNAENLLTGMIDMMRAKPSRFKKHFRSETLFNIPLFINELHACRSDLRSPFLLAAVKSQENPSHWLKKQIYLNHARKFIGKGFLMKCV